MRNAPLHDAVLRFVAAALGLWRVRGQPSDALVAINAAEWQPQPDDADVFVRREGVQLHWGGRLEDEVAKLPENLEVVRLLEADPIIGPRQGKMVSRGSYAQSLSSLDNQALAMLRAVTIGPGGVVGEAFESAYLAWERDLYAESDEHVVLYPLAVFKSSAEPMRLGPSAVARRMSDDEVARCLQTGLIDAFQGQVGLVHDSRWCVAGTVKTLRVTYDADATEPFALINAAHQREVDELTSLADEFVRTLRLYKSGGVQRAGRLELLGDGALSYARSRVFLAPPYELTGADGDDVKRLWDALRSRRVRENRGLQTALRRFSFASERPLAEDRIIDLMIAAEAWFVGLGRDELSHRLALNAAGFLAPSRSKRSTYDFLHHAYQVRSQIVHGAAPKNKDLVLETGENVDERRFAEGLRDFMSDALRLAVNRVANGTWNGDWLELALGEAP